MSTIDWGGLCDVVVLTISLKMCVERVYGGVLEDTQRETERCMERSLSLDLALLLLLKKKPPQKVVPTLRAFLPPSSLPLHVALVCICVSIEEYFPFVRVVKVFELLGSRMELVEWVRSVSERICG